MMFIFGFLFFGYVECVGFFDVVLDWVCLFDLFVICDVRMDWDGVFVWSMED